MYMATVSPPSVPTPNDVRSKRAEILWVSDREFDRESLEAELTAPAHFRYAESPSNALLELGTRVFDVIVVDMRSRGSSGEATLRRLRLDGVRTIVLGFCPDGDVPTALTAIRAGAADIVTSASAVSDHLQRRGAARNAFVHPASRRSADEAGAATRAVIRDAVDQFVHANGCDPLGQTCPPLDVRPALQTRAGFDLLAILIAALAAEEHPKTFLACAGILKALLHGGDLTARSGLLERLADDLVNSAVPSGPATQLCRKMVHEIETSISHGQRPKARSLATALGVDERHLCRSLERDSGLSFREWRSATCLSLAARELTHTQNRISEIAYRIGFVHPSELARSFRTVTGASPKQFRRIDRVTSRYQDAPAAERSRAVSVECETSRRRPRPCRSLTTDRHRRERQP